VCVSKAGSKAAGAAAAMLTLQPVAATAAIGPDAAACAARSGRTALIVNVRGFRGRTGSLRIAAYGSNAADFLARGRWVRRIDLPVARSGSMPVCVALPRPGRYAIAVRHDENGDGHSDWSDGGGFSRNPALAFPSPRPAYEQVAINVPAGVHGTDIILNYRAGLHIGPISGGGR
jgi:uncharacterized protein (DUF2141 family)